MIKVSSDKHGGPAKDVETRERATDLEIPFKAETVSTEENVPR